MRVGQFDAYCQFLQVLTEKLNKSFENQKEYIHCKEGCSLCCRQGEYPCSELEYEFLRLGMITLSVDDLRQVHKNILQLKDSKAKVSPSVTFEYQCPFLINDRCSVYKYRPVICRTFGLPFFTEQNGKQIIKTPFCVHHNLNYSDIYDEEKNVLSMQKFKEKGYSVEPLAFNYSLKFILKELGENGMGLDFGEEKSLIDWL